MGNERFRKIMIGDNVWVYDVESEQIREVTVIGIKGNHFDKPTHLFRGATFNFGALHYVDGTGTPRMVERGSFFVNFNEETSRRGTEYVGFLNKEDAVEKLKEDCQITIDELKNKIKDVEKSIHKLT